ncbi:MAG: cation transporter, partial [Clostridia bacterium]|nr:cation transporter [Clostridia bacterium]
MSGANIALTAALAVVVGFAAWRTAMKLRKGGGCCGEREAAVKRNRASRPAGRFDHELTLTIGGMTCENCARRVENALNGVRGVRASVRLDTRTARVRC